MRAAAHLRARLAAIGLAISAALLLAAGPGLAHESDQYTLPIGREFADLGPHFSRIVDAAVIEAVAQTNAAIGDALAADQPDRLHVLQGADHIAEKVWMQLFLAFPSNEVLDSSLVSENFRAQYPGLVTLHWAVPSVYDDPLLLLDISKFVRTFFRAGTVSANGTVIGTDKIIHFVNLGRIYHAKYQQLLEQGQAPEQASANAIAVTGANPFLSEDGFLGLMSTGIRSNADLAADLAGFKFYRNLSEPVHIGTRSLPPMLAREGPFWRVAMRPGAQHFSRFISAHWNEVLNPNKYLDYFAWRVRDTVRERCADVLDAYRDRHGRRMSQARFAAIETELSTYFGEAYEHESNGDDRVSVASVCFGQAQGGADDAALMPVTSTASGALQPGGEVDALGRSSLWWAARGAQADAVARWLQQGADANAPDVDGETALHAAVRSADPAVVRRLLAHGSVVNAAALYGVTPLMLATANGQVAVAGTLLDGGADATQRGPFGRTPLHLAVLAGDAGLAALLLQHGADASAADDFGQSALGLAARQGHRALVAMLESKGRVLASRNAQGATPAPPVEPANATH